MLSRNASTDLDAVYFNPAGLTQLKNGFYFGLNNQTLFQTRAINTTAPLNNKEFNGEVTIPVFPTAFAVYKLDNLAFSVGFGPNGGGGTAKYSKGLPSFEGKIANQVNNQLVPGLASLSQLGYNVQPGYDVNIQFEGQSVFWGIQLGVSAKINEVISGYAGVRYLPSVNTYTGSIKNISLKVNGEFQNANEFLTSVATEAKSKADQLSALASLAASFPAGDQVTNPVLGGALTALGQDPTKLNNGTANAILTSVSGDLNTKSQSLDATAVLVDDIEVDTKQTGQGFTPIIGINISPTKDLNIGLRYEHKTSLVLTNDTRKSDAGMDFLKDGVKMRSDIPGIITAGVQYKISEKLVSSVSFNQFLDKGVDWGKNIYLQDRTIDNNSWEIMAGFQYNISDNFAVSIGGMHSNTGVSEQYQSDFNFISSSNTGALGLQWKVSEKMTLDAGFLRTIYEDEHKSFTDHNETYSKDNTGFAIGISYKIL
jgi:long-subunit fatty acid transport protein